MFDRTKFLRAADGVGSGPAPVGPVAKPKTMEDITPQYFPPENIATEGKAYLDFVGSVAAGKISANFDGDTQIPANYGLLVAPISARQKNSEGNVTIGAIACLVPTMDLLGSTPAGMKFLRDAALQNMRTKIANAVRPDKHGQPSGTIPFTVEDFIENRREAGVMKAFNETAPTAVASLKKLGFSFMTVPLLKQVLMSKAFAESQFPKVPQDHWIKVLQLLIGRATAKALDVSVMANWQATRDNAAASQVGEFDLDKLDSLMEASDAADAKAAAETAEKEAAKTAAAAQVPQAQEGASA